jgi:hypothetical protein
VELSRGWANKLLVATYQNLKLLRGMSRHIAIYRIHLLCSSDVLTKITLGATVKKQFEHPDAVDRVSHLVMIYRLLKEKRVPNTDALHSFSQEPPSFYVMTTPLGMDYTPKSGFEAFTAIVCLLEALQVNYFLIFVEHF